MGLSYDRRVPEELLKALEPGGFAHSLVEFGGSGMWALDLQLRGLGEAKKQHRATLYVGTTKVVDHHITVAVFRSVVMLLLGVRSCSSAAGYVVSPPA